MGQPVIFVSGRDPLIPYSGAETYVRAAGQAAIAAGYEPHIFCVGATARVSATPCGIVHCATTPFRPIRGLMAAVHGPAIVRAIDRFASGRAGPCLIHGFGSWIGVAAAATRRLERQGIACALIATAWSTYAHETRGKLRGANGAHGPWNKLALRWELVWTLLTVSPGEKRGLRRADLVNVNYESVRAIVAAEAGMGVRFRKAAYAAETAFLSEDGADRSPPAAIAGLEPRAAPLIVAISRHDARKGVDVVLRALARLRADGVQFRACLIGGGPLLQQHRALAAKLDLLTSTAVTGPVPDAFTCLQQADIFALPSIEEGSGSFSLLEAMQAGVAPVASGIDGLPEDLTEGESGLLVPPGDAVALAAALHRLIEDPGLRKRLADGAHAAYRERFSPAAFGADLRAAYMSLGFAPFQ